MNFFNKGATLILQILFVVILVLVFAWFDPFDILTPAKKVLKDTPVQVESIREIGQLITAEYYGEVISSLKEVVNEKDYNELKEFNTIVNDLHEDFKEAMVEFSQEEHSGSNQKIYDAFKKNYPELVGNKLFGTYLYYIREKIKNNNYKRSELDNALRTAKRNRLIKRLYKNNLHWRDKLLKIQTDDFKEVKKEMVKRSSKKDFRHSRLVIVGRGWVKAGFDFRKFTERNFHYDGTYKRIHFIGLEPKVLSATINPWFIPEEGVEGFEFLIAERGARLKPEYTRIVKQRCLDKLQQQAMEKQILMRSKKNAEYWLKNFFSLLLDEHLQGVYFHTNYLTYTMDVLLQDSVITNEEFYTIDSSLVYYVKNYDDEEKMQNIANFIAKLRNYKALIYGNEVSLNGFTPLLFAVMQDRTIDSAEVRLIDKPKPVTLSDSLWYAEYFMPNNENSDSAQTDSLLKTAILQSRKDFCSDLKNLIKVFKVNTDSVPLPASLSDSL